MSLAMLTLQGVRLSLVVRVVVLGLVRVGGVGADVPVSISFSYEEIKGDA